MVELLFPAYEKTDSKTAKTEGKTDKGIRIKEGRDQMQKGSQRLMARLRAKLIGVSVSVDHWRKKEGIE